MKSRDSDPAFPIELLIGVVALTSWAINWITFNRGLPWMVAYAGAMLLVMAGALQLFRAKLPLYRQGRFFTFGPQSLPGSSLPLYRNAVRLIVAGVAACGLLLLPRFVM